MERKWFATSHGRFLDDRANPMIIGIPTPLPPSIKACSSPLQANGQGSQEISHPYAARAFLIPLRPNPSKETIVTYLKREACPIPDRLYRGMFYWQPAKRECCVEAMVVFFFWFINVKRLLVMVPLLFLIMFMSYVFFDWYIVVYTGFYACVRVVSCMCRCPITEIVGIVIFQGEGMGAPPLLQTTALDSR